MTARQYRRSTLFGVGGCDRACTIGEGKLVQSPPCSLPTWTGKVSLVSGGLSEEAMEGDNDEHTDICIVLGAELIYVDVSVVHTTCASYFCDSAVSSLAAARRAETRKNRQYLDRAQRDHATFVPFILETYGGFGRSARNLVNKIAGHARAHSEIWSTQNIKTKILRGIFEELHLRNLRMLTNQLNRCHRPPPLRPRSSRTRVQQAPAVVFTANPRRRRRPPGWPPASPNRSPQTSQLKAEDAACRDRPGL